VQRFLIRRASRVQRVCFTGGRGSQFELDALRERQLLAPVDRIGLAAHVGLPGVGARLATAARFLLAAESTSDLGARRADFTFAMPQSEPSADRKSSAWRTSVVKIAEESPCGTSLCMRMASSIPAYGIT
jgi:hypothetical protein